MRRRPCKPLKVDENVAPLSSNIANMSRVLSPVVRSSLRELAVDSKAMVVCNPDRDGRCRMESLNGGDVPRALMRKSFRRLP